MFRIWGGLLSKPLSDKYESTIVGCWQPNSLKMRERLSMMYCSYYKRVEELWRSSCNIYLVIQILVDGIQNALAEARVSPGAWDCFHKCEKPINSTTRAYVEASKKFLKEIVYRKKTKKVIFRLYSSRYLNRNVLLL